MNIIKIETRGATQPRARAFIYVMHDCRRHEFVIIFTFYNRHSIQIQPLKLLVMLYRTWHASLEKNLLSSSVALYNIYSHTTKHD